MFIPDYQADGTRFGYYYFAALAALLGAGCGARGFWLRSRANATTRWKPVAGEVIGSALGSRERRSRRRSGLFRGEVLWLEYRPEIEYVYQVDGKDYIGKRVYFGAHEWSRSETFAEELIRRYPVKSAPRVFHDVARPDQSVLERGRDQVSKNYIRGFYVLLVLASLALIGSRLVR